MLISKRTLHLQLDNTHYHVWRTYYIFVAESKIKHIHCDISCMTNLKEKGFWNIWSGNQQNGYANWYLSLKKT